jgi:hypothetical protein
MGYTLTIYSNSSLYNHKIIIQSCYKHKTPYEIETIKFHPDSSLSELQRNKSVSSQIWSEHQRALARLGEQPSHFAIHPARYASIYPQTDEHQEQAWRTASIQASLSEHTRIGALLTGFQTWKTLKTPNASLFDPKMLTFSKCDHNNDHNKHGSTTSSTQ